ncbi:MAG: response regulator [Sumerlaeia bacterium]
MWRILIVDDEDDVRMIIRTTLQGEYECLEAHDGLDALEKLARYEPDFVLMDVMMPLLDGFEACHAIRKNPKYTHLPVMFLTALGSRDDMKKGYGAGANLYLTKPFEPSRLKKNIDVFFQTTPPQKRLKRYTLKQIQEFEKNKTAGEAPGAEAFEEQRDSPVPRAAAPESPAPPARALPRAMVVDDDPDILELIGHCLAGVAEVVTASDGLQAIENLVKYQPDLLIIDIMLPKMSGFQLCQSLRQNRSFARLPIIICSAKSAERDMRMAQRMGANAYLAKPFAPEELTRKVRAVQELPDFRIRPKTYTIERINQMEGKDQDAFAMDDEVKSIDQSKREIDQFLKKEGSKKGTERDEPESPPDEPSRKRRLFGFGKK